MSIELPQKEWWRERRVTPATFFGFPDVSQAGLRGGSLYVEQMDSVTLAVLADRCLKQQVWDPDIWAKFSWRAQQMANRTHEPDLCYIFRAFARADWFDQNFLTTYLGRLHRRLYNFRLPDVAVLLEAFANPRFRQSNYLQKALTHLTLLLQHRDDAKAEDLARTCAALRQLRPLEPKLHHEVLAALELLAEAMLQRDLGELGASRIVKVVDCYVAWGMVEKEALSPDRSAGSNASTDLCWALLRELKGQLRPLGREKPEELSVLALAMATGHFQYEELWSELTHELDHEAHRLSGPSAAAAVYAVARGGPKSVHLNEVVARRLSERQAELSALDCARATLGFFRGPAAIAERAVCRGPVFERVLDLGLETFDGEALSLLLDALARAPAEVSGVEAIAGTALEAAHAKRGSMSARQLASVARSLTYLRPSASSVLVEILDSAQAAAKVAAESEVEDVRLHPRQVAMLAQAISSQPAKMVPDAPKRLESLLPLVSASLDQRPTAVTAFQLLYSLVRCPASEGRTAALNACASRLSRRACDLTAVLLVQLSESLAAHATAKAPGAAWAPPAALLSEVSTLLDIKRYDLGPGILWRAAGALEIAGAPALRLEERDAKPEKRDAKPSR